MTAASRTTILIAAAVASATLGAADASAQAGEAPRLIAAAADASAPQRPDDPFPARSIDASGLHGRGFGAMTFEARDGHELTAMIYRGSRFEPQSGPIWFVLHGASRAVERYIRAAAPAAERHAALAIAIEFPQRLYPDEDYTLGVTTRGEADGRAFAEGRWRTPDSYLYAEIEHVFEAVRRELDGRQRGYYLFGHSAGAQFTHRLLTFLPNARAIGAVAANAGWYTLPVAGDLQSRRMPYGLQGSPLAEDDLRELFAAPFVVLLGERDTTTTATDELLRGTAEAMAQGATRLERGRFYFSTAEAQARALGTKFAWRLAVVPRASHDAAQMIDSAAFLLFAPSESPCRASSAGQARGLVIGEVLADPPQGDAGDANGDGERDPAHDEFVEIVNAGTAPVCLSGWSLGDAEDAERHVFPLGRALAPGKALVVFGGGVPTGDFGGAIVQRAAFADRLSLTNDGDVVTLRDGAGLVAAQLSWGDCAGQACATEHWAGDLGIAGSIVRWPPPGGGWRAHAEVGGSRFSPGIRADGSRW